MGKDKELITQRNKITYINFTKEELNKINNSFLVKYMPLSKAIQSLEEHYLWFAAPEKWSDPFEKRFITNVWEPNNIYKTQGHPWKNRTYCLCMTNTTISEAHWIVYSRQEIGISFKIKFGELIKILEQKVKENEYDIYIGRVNYKPEKKILQPLPKMDFMQSSLGEKDFLAELLFLKRNAFKYENEVRIILVRKEDDEIAKNLHKVGGLKIEFKDVQPIERVTIDPRVDTFTEEILRGWLTCVKEKYRVKYNTCPEMRFSTIYRNVHTPEMIKINDSYNKK